MVTNETFENWLTTYGAAWEARDPDAAVRIFSPGARYHWTPFGPPQVGHDEIAAAWGAATSRQQDIRFRFTIWSVADMRGIAHWNARFKRIDTGSPVEIDGVLLAEFDAAGLCHLFREWWHSTDSA